MECTVFLHQDDSARWPGQGVHMNSAAAGSSEEGMGTLKRWAISGLMRAQRHGQLGRLMETGNPIMTVCHGGAMLNR